VTTRAGLTVQYDAIRAQIDKLASASSFNGINLLNSANSSNLTLTLNETVPQASPSMLSISPLAAYFRLAPPTTVGAAVVILRLRPPT